MAWISHPSLDGGQRMVEVPDESLPHHQRAGWEVADPPGAPPENDPESTEAPVSAGASVLSDESPRRRRVTKEGEE